MPRRRFAPVVVRVGQLLVALALAAGRFAREAWQRRGSGRDGVLGATFITDVDRLTAMRFFFAPAIGDGATVVRPFYDNVPHRNVVDSRRTRPSSSPRSRASARASWPTCR